MIIPRHVLLRQSYCIFCHNCLSRRSVGCNKDRITHFQMVHSLLLEGIELERILYFTVKNGGYKGQKNGTLCAISGTSSWKLLSGVFTSMTWAQSRFWTIGRFSRLFGNPAGWRLDRLVCRWKWVQHKVPYLNNRTEVGNSSSTSLVCPNGASRSSPISYPSCSSFVFWDDNWTNQTEEWKTYRLFFTVIQYFRVFAFNDY